jgi:hypothetical protein
VRIHIGNRLRQLRPTKGVSLADLEAQTGLPQGRIGVAQQGTETPTLNIHEVWAVEPVRRRCGRAPHPRVARGETGLGGF